MSYRDSSSSNGSSSSIPRTDILDNVRVVDQSRPQPDDTPEIPPTSRTFRVASFVYHLGLSMLESQRGFEALVDVGIATWNAYGRRGRRDLVIRGDVERNPRLMTQFATKFLRKCRNDPPTIIVSDRIQGEGLASRVNWTAWLGEGEDDYNAKWAGLFRLNKTVLDNAVYAADAGSIEDFQKFLFLLSLSVAHELVHMFIGYMVGDSGRNTPPQINHPPGTPGSGGLGESGRFWEMKFFGYIIGAFYDPNHPLRTAQPGIFYASNRPREAYIVNADWISSWLRFDFSDRLVLDAGPGGRPFRLRSNEVTMEDVRGIPVAQDFTRDLTEFFETLNSLPVYRVGSRPMAELRLMPFDPTYIRAPPQNRSRYR